MPREKLAGMAIIAVGVVIAFVSIFADVLGITPDPNTFDLDTFRYNQQWGTGIGIVILIAGVLIYNYGERFFSGDGYPTDE